MLLLINNALQSSVSLPLLRDRVDVAIKIREHSRINNRNEVLVYILYTHFEGFESSCTFFFFFAIQLKEQSLLRSIQTRIRPKLQ